jgi:DNA oxidative demethylase
MYAVKEIFYTLQGEGANAGTPAVFCRFTGCNLWSGREEDRAKAVCQFCDTDFVETDGARGGRYTTAGELAAACRAACTAAEGSTLIQTMSVAMTNCGAAGWVTDRRGYRYDRTDPLTGKPWPSMPPALRYLAQRAAAEAGYPGFEPDACLINRYAPGSRLTLHQDKNERDFGAPIVSVSLGLPAKFLFGGLERNDRAQRVMVHHGDVTVWGGPSRLVFHGVDTLKDGEHPATGRCRINLTFRTAL